MLLLGSARVPPHSSLIFLYCNHPIWSRLPTNQSKNSIVKQMKLKPADMKHIESLAKKYDVTLVTRDEAIRKMGVLFFYQRGSFATKNLKTGEKLLYLNYDELPTQDEAYICAMHEIGHFAMGHHGIARDDFDTEAEASEWAVNHLRRPMTDGLVIPLLDALFTYAHESLMMR